MIKTRKGGALSGTRQKKDRSLSSINAEKLLSLFLSPPVQMTDTILMPKHPLDPMVPERLAWHIRF